MSTPPSTPPIDPPPQPGPYESTSRTTYRFTPFEFSTIKEVKSSHVPPPAAPCGCHDDDDNSNSEVIEAIMKMGQLIISSMQQQAQPRTANVDPSDS